MEVLASAVRQQKEKASESAKKSNSLFSDDMILYVENPKDSTLKLLKLTQEFSKEARYKISAFLFRNQLHFYTLRQKKEKLRSQSHLQLHPKP